MVAIAMDETGIRRGIGTSGIRWGWSGRERLKTKRMGASGSIAAPVRMVRRDSAMAGLPYLRTTGALLL